MFFKKGEREERVGGSRGWIELLADYNKWNRYPFYFSHSTLFSFKPFDPPTPSSFFEFLKKKK